MHKRIRKQKMISPFVKNLLAILSFVMNIYLLNVIYSLSSSSSSEQEASMFSSSSGGEDLAGHPQVPSSHSSSSAAWASASSSLSYPSTSNKIDENKKGSIKKKNKSGGVLANEENVVVSYKQEKEDCEVSVAGRGEEGYIRPNMMFGHVHMSKTGGTTLNGILANRYERVCGIKGYSYDAYQANELALEKPGKVNASDNPRDKVILFGHGVMEEIGYEDCDYVSQERRWTFWNRFSDFHDIPMELHIPCRNRIDHLMSQCNYLHEKIDCDVDDHELYSAVDSCFAYMNRYSDELLHLKNIHVKCYDFKKQYTSYIDYMDQRLQRRRLESKPYKRRETNLPRRKDRECIWSRPDVYHKVDQYLLEQVPYYAFCQKCLGSEDDITREDEKD